MNFVAFLPQLDSFADTLRGRIVLNSKTAISHPDLLVRALAQARADAYHTALRDLVLEFRELADGW